MAVRSLAGVSGPTGGSCAEDHEMPNSPFLGNSQMVPTRMRILAMPMNCLDTT